MSHSLFTVINQTTLYNMYLSLSDLWFRLFTCSLLVSNLNLPICSVLCGSLHLPNTFLDGEHLVLFFLFFSFWNVITLNQSRKGCCLIFYIQYYTSQLYRFSCVRRDIRRSVYLFCIYTPPCFLKFKNKLAEFCEWVDESTW